VRATSESLFEAKERCRTVLFVCKRLLYGNCCCGGILSWRTVHLTIGLPRCRLRSHICTPNRAALGTQSMSRKVRRTVIYVEDDAQMNLDEWLNARQLTGCAEVVRAVNSKSLLAAVPRHAQRWRRGRQFQLQPKIQLLFLFRLPRLCLCRKSPCIGQPSERRPTLLTWMIPVNTADKAPRPATNVGARVSGLHVTIWPYV